MNVFSPAFVLAARRVATKWMRAVVAVCALGVAAAEAGADADRLPAVGAVAATDLVAPVDVQVSPGISAGRVATRDGKLLPAVARFDATAADAAERELDAAFAQARIRFVDALEQAFGARVIDDAKIASLRFQSLRNDFVANHPEFPVGHVLAAAWARGEDGDLVRDRLAGALRQVMGRHLIGSMPRTAMVFVVAVPREVVVRAWAEASPALVRAVDRSAILSLDVARAELWRHLGVGDRLAGGFLETLVRENVAWDARLTALFLHDRLGAQLEGRFVGRGEAIVRAGEPIDAWAAEALRQLEQLGLAPLTPVTVVPVAVPEPPAAQVVQAPLPAPPQPSPAAAVDHAPADVAAPEPPALLPVGWLAAMAAALFLSGGLGLWVVIKLRRLRRTRLDLRPTEPAGDMREVLAREMTRQGMDALFTQRQELLQTTAVATERVAEMETRVAHVQPAIQERIRNYERRIQALERELQER